MRRRESLAAATAVMVTALLVKVEAVLTKIMEAMEDLLGSIRATPVNREI